MPGESGQERQLCEVELGRVGGLDLLARVLGLDAHTVVAPRRQPAVRAQADGGVDRLRAFMKQVERPDVEGAAGEVDPCRRGGVDVHPRIIMADECRFGIFDARPGDL